MARSWFSRRRNRPILWWFLGFLSGIITLFAITLWFAGAVYSEVPERVALSEGPFKVQSKVDAIVVLAGGRGRIKRALKLFEKGYGELLYISGTGPQVSMREILRQIKWLGAIDQDQVILESVSTNTIQNAEEFRKFVRDQDIQKILLVTSSYHVRRAYFIFEKILPRDIQIDVTWHEQKPYQKANWWKAWNGIWVTVGEFFKFYYAYLVLA